MPGLKMDSNTLGRRGEIIARKFLQNRGYSIIEENYHSRYGEIDIIARDGEIVVFVEVKLRKNANFAQAREFVTYKKQEKIIKTADIWLSENQNDYQLRFDVIEVYTGLASKKTLVNHIENAFYLQ